LARPGLDVGGDFAIGHYTHEKNPVTAAAALATLEVIEEEGLVERAADLGAHALARLRCFGADQPLVGDVRGRGLMLGVEIVKDRATREENHEAAERIFYRCLEGGVSFKISQGCVLTLSPPLVISREDLDRALDVVQQAIEQEGRRR
ncbi:MAG: aminotransferase class III-fold pyridoxal phosphate-dependent enzyme, partial [bacterium]|nr:aminotransferase class III-fold pyridoxal phosphate-dependent enzyme [bacterium]